MNGHPTTPEEDAAFDAGKETEERLPRRTTEVGDPGPHLGDDTALHLPPPPRRPNRAERRAAGATNRGRARRSPPVVVRDAEGKTSGAELGGQFENHTLAKLPGKRYGRHRWVAVASYVLSDEDVAVSDAPGSLAMLDGTRMIHLALGCWDCGKSKGQAEPGSFCTGTKP